MDGSRTTKKSRTRKFTPETEELFKINKAE